jgi:hypothetical protein
MMIAIDKQDNNTTTLLSLPKDVLRYILCMDVLSPLDVARQRRTCRLMLELCSCNSVWFVLFNRYWGDGAAGGTETQATETQTTTATTTTNMRMLIPRSALENWPQNGQRFRNSVRSARMQSELQSLVPMRMVDPSKALDEFRCVELAVILLLIVA